MGEIINGLKISKEKRLEIKKRVELLKEEGVYVCLAVVLVGNNPASKIYVKNKKKACEELGIISKEILLDENVKKEELKEIINSLNEDLNVNGILLQLPLPKHLNENEIINYINPLKDVDCFSVKNTGKLFNGNFYFSPCTPSGIIDLIKSTNVKISGKNAVIVGRSNIVGKPMAMLLLKENATVCICHSKTENLEFFTKNADILVVAIGRPNFIRGNMVKKGAVVIDVGINRLSNNKLCGDVLFEEVLNVAGFLTPVPGGVGPMTITKLMENTIKAVKIQKEKLKC